LSPAQRRAGRSLFLMRSFMSISVLDLFKIGIGPSSSHTVGPMRAAHDFVQALETGCQLGAVRRVRVQLYGSLAATGIGHGTDRAVVVGLMGQRPDQVDPDFIAPAVEGVRRDQLLRLGGKTALPFHWARDMQLLRTALPYHPNAMRLTAYGHDGALFENTYYSIGGGFVVDEAQARSGAAAAAARPLRYEFNNAAELLALCREHGLRISEVMLANELAWRSEEETRAALQRIWEAMQRCIARGIAQEGTLRVASRCAAVPPRCIAACASARGGRRT
jgi:L-serine dehydratase